MHLHTQQLLQCHRDLLEELQLQEEAFVTVKSNPALQLAASLGGAPYLSKPEVLQQCVRDSGMYFNSQHMQNAHATFTHSIPFPSLLCFHFCTSEAERITTFLFSYLFVHLEFGMRLKCSINRANFIIKHASKLCI